MEGPLSSNSTNPETNTPAPEQKVEMNVAPSAESSAEQPKEMSKSQLKKLAKQKNAKPKMSKEEKMKAVGCGEVVYYILVGTEGKCGCWRRKED